MPIRSATLNGLTLAEQNRGIKQFCGSGSCLHVRSGRQSLDQQWFVFLSTTRNPTEPGGLPEIDSPKLIPENKTLLCREIGPLRCRYLRSDQCQIQSKSLCSPTPIGNVGSIPSNVRPAGVQFQLKTLAGQSTRQWHTAPGSVLPAQVRHAGSRRRADNWTESTNCCVNAFDVNFSAAVCARALSAFPRNQ
jgi:hypothetical protein